MINTYEINLTPSKARRLVRASEIISTLEISDEVREIAEQGVYTFPDEAEFVAKTAQQILDFDFRCTICMSSQFKLNDVIRAIRLGAKIRNISKIYAPGIGATNIEENTNVEIINSIPPFEGRENIINITVNNINMHTHQIFYNTISIFHPAQYMKDIPSFWHNSKINGISINQIMYMTEDEKEAVGLSPDITRQEAGILCHSIMV